MTVSYYRHYFFELIEMCNFIDDSIRVSLVKKL
jgi:hypothetical protein